MRLSRLSTLLSSTALVAGLTLVATPTLAKPTTTPSQLRTDPHQWVRAVRRATARDVEARACAMPQIIRYQSTLALLHRAARQPDLFTRVAEKRWRLRLFELQLAANSCLPNASDAPKRAALVVTVDLPRDVFTEGSLDAEAWTDLADRHGPASDTLTPALRR